jgi:PAS domain S-box-containing protein
MTSKILIVEDEAVIARDIQVTLRELGYLVPPPVASGEMALQAVAAGSPDLVLMDIRIQGDLDGIQTAARIRELHGTPVVYLTSHSDETTVSRAKSTGAYGYVLKPFHERDLRIAIEVALQKREIERLLSERERWFATTLRSISDAVIATDPEQRITFMNPVAERVTGHLLRDVEGRALNDVFCLLDPATGARLESPLTRAFQDSFSAQAPASVALSTRSEGTRAIDNSAACIVDDKGKMLGGVVVFRDVTARRQLEDRLAKNERLAAIGTLSAGMAHEINNPLAYVLANVSFAVETLEEVARRIGALPGPEAEALGSRVAQIGEALGDAREGSMRVHRIVHDLKKFGRLDTAERNVVELTDILDSAIRLTENVLRHNARVRRDYKAAPSVAANEGQLAQVFVNLLLNATQAFEHGDVRENEIVVATYTDELGRAVAEVRDSGPGIAQEVQRRIFDPFFTTKPVGEGVGLGLSIAHSIVEALGGEISLESTMGIGTAFRVALPAGKRREEEKPLAIGPVPSRRGRVLVIDDEPAIGRAMIRVLQRDHDVSFVGEAREALSRIAGGASFDVVLCDLMMPGMNGMEFFEAVREEKPDLARRIVFVTGGAFTPRSEAFLQSTANACLVKPVEPAALRKVVAEFLSEES